MSVNKYEHGTHLRSDDILVSDLVGAALALRSWVASPAACVLHHSSQNVSEICLLGTVYTAQVLFFAEELASQKTVS